MYSRGLKLLISNLLIYNLGNCFDLRCEPFDSQQFNKFSEYFEFVGLIQPVNTKCLLSQQQSEKVITDKTAKMEIDHLKLLKSNFSSISNEIFKDLPNLLRLNASNCKIASIEETTFFSLKKLEIIDLSFNDLIQLSVNTFLHNENLMVLDLSNNKFLRLKVIKIENLQLLDLSSNQISKIQKDTFQFALNLNVLILQNNNLVQIHEEFRNLINLTVLVLSDNKIKQLSGTSFDGLKSIVWLDLRNNQISRINSKIFKNHAKLEDLKLQENTLKIVEKNSLNGLIDLKSLALKGSSSSFDFDNLQNVNDKLDDLFIQYFKTPLLDKSLLKKFKHLTVLNLGKMSIVEIEDNCFEHMKDLENLLLDDNRLTAITNSTFKGLESLKILSLIANRITNLPSDAFTALKKLEKLDLFLNAILQIESIVGLGNLQTLNLARSRALNYIGPSALKDLVNLRNLDIGENELNQLTADSFKGLVSLTEIRIWRNDIKNLSGLFKELVNLKSLTMGHGNLIDLSKAMEGANRALTSLEVSYNHIQNFGSALQPFTMLESLDLGFNRMTNLTSLNFKGLVHINFLDLTYNQIDKISEGSFKDLANVENLILRFNSLEKVTVGMFAGLKSLKILNLGKNQINVIEEGAMADVPNLESLYLIENPLKKFLPYGFYGLKKLREIESSEVLESIAIDSYRGLSSLESLNLDEKSLPVIVKGTFIGLKNLTKLSLFKSKIQSIEECAFVGLDNITSLNLDQNIINNLEKYMFKGLFHLKELSLSYSQVKKISPFAFEEMWNLETLNLGYNLIYEIKDDTFKGLNNLKVLNCEWAGLQKISPHSFQPLKNITTINLFHLCFGKLNPPMFRGLHKLKKVSLEMCQNSQILYKFDDQFDVDLSINLDYVVKNQNVSLSHLRNIAHLTIVSMTNFAQQKEIFLDIPSNLISLKISHVKIQIVENKLIKSSISLLAKLVNLKNLDLSASSLKSIEKKSFDQLKQLKKLDLMDNEIIFNDIELFKNLENLLKINLSGNTINVLKKEMFSKNVWLEEMYLSRMQIELVEENSFDFLPNLKILDLSENKLKTLTNSLFESNLNLQTILLSKNQITFLTSKLFNNLERLVTLDMWENNCFSALKRSETNPADIEHYLNSDVRCFGCTVGYLGDFGRGVDIITGMNFKEYDKTQQFQSMRILCEPGYAFVKVKSRDDTVTCRLDGWDKDFPICTKLCPGNKTLGYTTQSKCFLNKELVPCSRDQSPGTEAHLTCAVGYQLQENFTGSERMTCLEGGKWDSEPIQCKPICGRITSKSIPLIIAGQDTESVVNTPWQAAIYRQTTNSDKLDCGGSILTKRIILSAAHCFFIEDSQTWNKKENYKIVVGKYYRKFDANEAFSTQTFGIDEIRTVSGFNGFSGFYISDIAIIILNGLIDFQPHIIPICIDLNIKFGLDQIVNEKEIGVVAGWGNTKAGGIPSRVLKSIELPVVDFQQCEREAGDFKPFVTPDKFCSGFTNGSGVCKGDSGGGLMFKKFVENGATAYYIKGIVSNGRFMKEKAVDSCDNFYTLFTNVLEYIPFIREAVEEFP